MRAEGEEESRITQEHTHTHTYIHSHRERAAVFHVKDTIGWLPADKKKKHSCNFCLKLITATNYCVLEFHLFAKMYNETNQRKMTKQNNTFYNMKELILQYLLTAETFIKIFRCFVTTVIVIMIC